MLFGFGSTGGIVVIDRPTARRALNMLRRVFALGGLGGTNYAQPPYPPSAEAYGREAGVFYRSARRCAVDESVMPGDVTPRGGIFDGATVGGPGCTYISPPPQVIPQLRPAEVPVPQLRPLQTEVAFVPVNNPLSGVGPDGIG